MRYAHVTNNWDLSNGKMKYGITTNYHAATECNKFHFMDNSTDEIAFKGAGNTFIKGFFDGWEGYSIICLDNDKITNPDLI